MGLFSFGKNKKTPPPPPEDPKPWTEPPEESFTFEVEDAFALQAGGAVVAGRVTEGVLRQGAQVLCVPREGESFLCTVESIEQADPDRRGAYIHPQAVQAGDAWQGRCALRLPGRRKEDFHPGDRLLPETPLEPQGVGFVFQVRDIFGLRNVGTGVSGVILRGGVQVGDRVSYGPAPGEVEFTCTVKDIAGRDAPGKPIAPSRRASVDGPCRAGCALTLDELDYSRFEPGGCLFIL